MKTKQTGAAPRAAKTTAGNITLRILGCREPLNKKLSAAVRDYASRKGLSIEQVTLQALDEYVTLHERGAGGTAIGHAPKTEIMVMGGNWKHHPNALFEDTKGALWIGYTTGAPRLKAVTTTEALSWVIEVSELADDQTGDVADVARIALKEIQRLLLSLGAVVELGRANKSKR